MRGRAPAPARPPRWCVAVVLCGALAGCDSFNRSSEPCPEISEAAFESALRAGDARGDIELSAGGVLSATIGGSLKTCRRSQGAVGGEVCRRSRDLVVRVSTPQRGVHFLKVPADRWHRFEARNPPGACRLLPG